MTNEEYMSKLDNAQKYPVSTFILNPDIEPKFTIDLDTREIQIPEEFKFIGVLNDSSAETVYFEMDRYFDGKDLSQYTIIVQFAVSDKNKSLNEGFCPVTEIDIDTDPSKIIFGWTITNEVTSFTGDVAFSIRIYEIEEVRSDFDSITVFSYCLNTLPAVLPVKNTLNVSNNISINYPSYLEEWNTRMQELDTQVKDSLKQVENNVEESNQILENIQNQGDQIVQEINTATTDARDQIGQAASDALKSISQANSKLPAITDNDFNKSVTIKPDATGYEYTGPYAPISAAITSTISGNPSICNDSIAWKLQGLKLYGKSIQNDTPSPETLAPIVSVGDNENVIVRLTGKNLFDISSISKEQTIRGIVVKKLEDGGINLDGSPTVSSGAILTIYAIENAMLPPGDYYIGGTYCFVRVDHLSGESQYWNNRKITIENGDKVSLYIQSMVENYSPQTIYPIFNFGSAVIPFEKPEKWQEISFYTTNGILGIPVSNGGNYTDSNDQQWVCDIKDYNSGKYLQYCKKFVFDGSEDEGWQLMEDGNDGRFRYISRYSLGIIDSSQKNVNSLNSNFAIGAQGSTVNTDNVYTIVTGGAIYVSTNGSDSLETFQSYLASNPMTLIGILPIPIETDIPAEELDVYRALTTYEKITIVSTPNNFSNMETKYITDTKKYIDNKINEAITAAITLAQGGN